MRVDAVNSYFSTMPIGAWSPVTRGNSQVPLPESKPLLVRTHTYDTIGRAEARPMARPTLARISALEAAGLHQLIDSQKARTDIVEMWFPALLNA